MGARAPSIKQNESDDSGNKRRVRPFLKWAGGKSQLLNEITRRLPSEWGCYHEPFLGGGAVYFAILPKVSHISDINHELIECYQVVRDRVEALIADLQSHHYDRDYFYSIRALDRSKGFKRLSPVKRASRMIFLNKTCFNGLYRVNSKGFFNTPFGDYSNPKILNAELLYDCSNALASSKITCEGYSGVVERTVKGDFVYLDPPYAPLSTTANFTSYSSAGFGPQQQIELGEICKALDKRGVKFMLSNSNTAAIRKLYSDFNLEIIQASRAINSVGAKRGKVEEVIVRNYE